MYRKSFEDLQTDYIDYYLLHSIGNGGIECIQSAIYRQWYDGVSVEGTGGRAYP